MTSPYKWQSPGTRIRHIKFAREREEERKAGLLEQSTIRLDDIRQNMDREQTRRNTLQENEARRFDTQTQQMDEQRQRKAGLEQRREGMARFRETEQRQQPGRIRPAFTPTPAREMAPLPPIQPGFTPEGVRERLLPGLTAGPGPDPIGRAFEEAETRFFEPIAAAGLQRLRATAISPGFERAPSGVGVQERPRQPREGFVNPFKALTSEEEQEKAQRVLEEAGLPSAIAARIIFDPLNVVPIVGFTKADDFVRAVRTASTATGKARTAVTQSPRFKRTIAAIRRGAAEGERGGPRVPGKGTELSTPQRIQRIHSRLARDWNLERLGPEVMGPEDVRPIAEQRVIAEFGDDPTITLYRGIGPDERPPTYGTRVAGEIGEYWSTEIERAAHYARGGKIYRVDVKASELADPVGGPVGIRGTKAGDEFVLPLEIQHRATPYQPPAAPRGVGPEDVTPVTPELGGFPTRFKGRARQLRGGPPRETPTGAPAGVSEPTWTDAVDKLNTGLRTSGQRLARTDIARSADRAKRIGEYQRIIEAERAAGTPSSEAFHRANAALTSEYAKFEAPAFGLTPQESEAIWTRAAEFDYGRKAFNQKHVADALLRIDQGEPLRRFEINALKKVFGPEIAETLDKFARTGSNWDRLLNSITVPRTILSSMDVSYPLRQGIKVSVRHPKEFWGNIKPMVKSFASEGVTEHIDDAIRTDALPIQMTNADGSITSTTWGQVVQDVDMIRPLPGAEAKFLSREEGFLSTIANKFPLVRNSARAFITYGNKLRSDVGRYWIQRWIRNGEEITPERLQALGNVLNRLTGRGTIGDNVVAEAVQTLGWAPKLTVSGPQAALQMFHSDPLIRRIAIENMVSFVGGGVALLSLAKLSGAAEVSLEPGADFGKMRIGNLRINVFGSDQVLARTIYEIASGEREDYLTGISPVNWKDSIIRYLRGRLSPEGGLITDIAAGKNYLMEEMRWDAETFWRELPERTIPLAIQDIKDTWQRQGPLAAIAVAPLAMLGLPTSSYETATQKLANAYNEQVERGEFGPNAKPYRDETPTTRKFNISQETELAELDAARNIASRKEIDEDKAGLEQEYGLPAAARRILAGEDALGPQFLKDFEEYQDKMQGIYFDKYFDFDPRLDSAEEKNLQVYRDISPNDPKYRDPRTNEVLWNEYFEDKDAAFGVLSLELQRALKESLKSLDPDVQKVETEMKKAKDVVDEFYDMPKYEGLSAEEGERLDDFLNVTVEELQRRTMREMGMAHDTITAIVIAAEESGLPEKLLSVAIQLSTKQARTWLIRPGRDEWLIKNERILSKFYPDLLERELSRAQEAGLGEQAFEAIAAR